MTVIKTVRRIPSQAITDAVAELCVKANTELTPDIGAALERAMEREKNQTAVTCLKACFDNMALAKKEGLAVCQDTGMCVVFCELGREAVVDGDLQEAINEGVRRGYKEGYLRCSVVSDPLRRVNTGDNTPATVYLNLTEGDRLRITVAPKGFGSENMSRLFMLGPSDGCDEVIERIVQTARDAGANSCPPVILGVGLGGTAESCMLAAKRELLRPIGQPHSDPFYAELERDALDAVNALGIGPQGLGGLTTALAVHIAALPTHIAGLPLAVNVGCHVTRHAGAVI